MQAKKMQEKSVVQEKGNVSFTRAMGDDIQRNIDCKASSKYDIRHPLEAKCNRTCSIDM